MGESLRKRGCGYCEVFPCRFYPRGVYGWRLWVRAYRVGMVLLVFGYTIISGLVGWVLRIGQHVFFFRVTSLESVSGNTLDLFSWSKTGRVRQMAPGRGHGTLRKYRPQVELHNT